MTRVVIGAADQAVASDLRTRLLEIDGTEVTYLAETTSELTAAVTRDKPDVVLIHDLLGPESAVSTIRELSYRAPATAMLLVTSVADAQGALAAFEAGVRGVLTYPLAYEDVAAKVGAARAWAERMDGLLSGRSGDSGGELGRRGRITAFAGAKGGVGTTTVATHMAVHLSRERPGTRVCLVDLDMQSGDVSGVLEARQRVSIADVARVAEDLSARTVTDALVLHDSGVYLLLSPTDIQDTEFVTAAAVRAVLSLLRQEFDVILVDVGSHVTPAQAAAVEVADEVVALVTPDVLAMRSWRRTITAWESLGVRGEEEVHLLVNRASREDVLTADAITRLNAAQVVSTRLPAMFRRLESAVNSRNPEDVREAVWWTAIDAIGREVDVANAVAARAGGSTGTHRGRRRRRARQAGQIAVETAALVPAVALICLLVWQLGLTALAFVWNGNAANAAARAQAVGRDPAQAARDAVPGSMSGSVHVSTLSQDTLRVATDIPVLCPGCASVGRQIAQTVYVVVEP